MPLHIRLYEAGDSIREITSLLNRAYAGLAEQGLRYVASWQTDEMTRERIQEGTCFLAFDGDELIGTVMLYPSDPESECHLYRQPGVFYFGKFAVAPELRGKGVGRRLFEAVQAAAIDQDATVLACDTAVPATHLVSLYEGWGFEVVARQNWSMTNYESVILAKPLDSSNRL